MPSKNKTEKTVDTKVAKVLSPKKQSELDHTLGKHKAEGTEILSMAVIENECGFCQRRVVRDKKKLEKTRRFMPSKSA